MSFQPQYFMCMQPIGLGGKQQIIPTQYPINLQYVVQQVTMYLMSQGFQVYPITGQNMAIIQAQHTSLLGYLTGSNKAYTIRICQGPNYVMVETGMTDLLQDLLPLLASSGFAIFSDKELHNKLLTLLGGAGAAIDAYNVAKDLMQEDQILNVVVMAVTSAPPLYPIQPNQQCWRCGSFIPSNAKYCPNCGSPQVPIKCPNCGYINPPNARYCGNCGSQLFIRIR